MSSTRDKNKDELKMKQACVCKQRCSDFLVPNLVDAGNLTFHIAFYKHFILRSDQEPPVLGGFQAAYAL